MNFVGACSRLVEILRHEAGPALGDFAPSLVAHADLQLGKPGEFKHICSHFVHRTIGRRASGVVVVMFGLEGLMST